MLKTIRELKFLVGNGGEVGPITQQMTIARSEVDDLFGNLPSLEDFEAMALDCDARSFFETLIMSTKNMTLSFQHNFYKIRNSHKANLIKRLRLLKEDFARNQRTIF
jgi:hypothetical protein